MNIVCIRTLVDGETFEQCIELPLELTKPIKVMEAENYHEALLAASLGESIYLSEQHVLAIEYREKVASYIAKAVTKELIQAVSRKCLLCFRIRQGHRRRLETSETERIYCSDGQDGQW